MWWLCLSGLFAVCIGWHFGQRLRGLQGYNYEMKIALPTAACSLRLRTVNVWWVVHFLHNVNMQFINGDGSSYLQSFLCITQDTMRNGSPLRASMPDVSRKRYREPYHLLPTCSVLNEKWNKLPKINKSRSGGESLRDIIISQRSKSNRLDAWCWLLLCYIRDCENSERSRISFK